MRKISQAYARKLLTAALAAGVSGAFAEEPVKLPHPATEAQTDEKVAADRSRLPEGFPSDLPLYDAMKTPTIARDGSRFTVRGQTPDSGSRVARRLQELMAGSGWERVADDRNPSEHHMTFTKGGREVGVTLTLEDQITLIYMEVPERKQGAREAG